jgi:hypothetical protein
MAGIYGAIGIGMKLLYAVSYPDYFEFLIVALDMYVLLAFHANTTDLWARLGKVFVPASEKAYNAKLQAFINKDKID